jgi:hypothetical protein
MSEIPATTRPTNLTNEEKDALRNLVVQHISKCHCKISEGMEKGSCEVRDIDNLVMRHGLLNQILPKLRNDS